MVDNNKWNKKSIGKKENILGKIAIRDQIGLGRPERFFN
jgi:hypothetical protein